VNYDRISKKYREGDAVQEHGADILEELEG
jgi:hypothetical protein